MRVAPATARPSRIFVAGAALLSTADELDDLDLRSGAQRRLAPPRLLDNAAVQFYRHSRLIELQLFQQAQNSLSVGDETPFAVHCDWNGHRFG